MKKEVLIGAIIVSLSVAGCGVLKPKPQEIDLNDYFSYEVTGYDGDARIEYSIDFEKIISDYENLEECNASKISNLINGSWTSSSNLSNGDEVTFVWDAHLDSVEEEYNVVFEYDDVEVVVDHLEVRPEFDPFEYMEVNLSGIAPDGSISISSAVTPIGTVYYSASSRNGLRNGDVITITAYNNTEGDLEYLADDCGYRLTSDTLEYTVTGLDEYVTTISDITEDALSLLQEQAVNAFYASTTWASDETVNSVAYDGMYFLSKRPESTSWGSNNRCYIVLKVNASNSNVSNIDYYYFVSYGDLVLLNDGTVTVNTTYYDVPYGSSFFGNTSGAAFVVDDGHYYVGYQDVNGIYVNEVQNNLVDYTYETTYTE
jgi:hypothetical protein